VRRGIVFFLIVLLGALCALLALGLDAGVRKRVGPGTVALRAHVGSGRTELRLPPLGKVSALTHHFPVTLEARVDEVDVDNLQALLGSHQPERRLQTEVSAGLEPLLQAFALRALLVAAVVGALAGALVPRRRWPHALAGLIGGVLAVGVVVGGAWRSYDTDAFKEARFEGPLERAPALLATVRRHVDDFSDVRKRMEVLGDQVAELYTAAAGDGLALSSTDEVRILHVSDVHSNPLGLEVTRQLAERFGVDAVLDTGDLTSFGLPVEGRLGELVRKVPARYLFVPGNHDSEANRKTLAGVPNVELLDGRVADVGGVRILGVADPTFTASNEMNSAQAVAVKRSSAPAVGAETEAQAPGILAVHDPTLAEAALGKVPVVVAGHVHHRSAVWRDGTLVLTVGSTGATGLGSFTVNTGSSYEAEVLRFVDGHLVAVDYVTLRGVGGSFRIDRQLIPPAEGTLRMAGQEADDLP
jgi:predicted phosphodiesterase